MAKLAKPRGGQQTPMVLEADQVVYDNDGQTVTALGKVQIRYNGYTLSAAKVTFLRKAKRVVAEGDARLVEPGGNVVTAARMDVTENFREGFVQALSVSTTERSRFSAESATRREGNVTVFENGAYNACQLCEADPGRPPFWEIRAAKIIHDQQERTISYEDARLEFLGVPIAYVPYFKHPDPTVTRKTGFLAPGFIASNQLGFGAQVPFFWAPAANWDVTFSPVLLSRQGLLGDVEVRHRMETGGWSFRAVGINQQNPDVFFGTSGDRVWRGAIFTKGEFNINEQWKWGWDGVLMSDRKFIQDYRLYPKDRQEATSTVYLTGQGERNWFDMRVYQFQIFEDDDPTKPQGVGKGLQLKQPVVHPVIDYDYYHPDPVLGGELSAHANFTSLSRLKTDVDLARQVYGLQGNYSRFSVDAQWRRQFIDSFGQVFTPMLGLRGDIFFNSNTNNNVGWVSDGVLARVTPMAGIEYRYPWIGSSLMGSHVLEPILQLITRPSERYVGHLPNEDAQSLVFDATNLFDMDKFSGFDRAEGGTRANAGMRYTFQANGGGSVSALFGQSYQIAGVNSFADPRFAKFVLMNPRPLTAYGSGLDSTSSDYVTSVLLDTGRGLRFGASARFDDRDMTINRAELQATGFAGPITASVVYAYLRTPDYLYKLLPTKYDSLVEPERSELQSALNMRLGENWRAFGSIRYDIHNSFVVNNTVGLGFDNDQFSSSVAYTEDTDRALTKSRGTRILTDRVVYFRFGLRTLGDGAISNNLVR
ncbi:LPS-assembly protein LptD [Prosthecomicrobium sp. N25]|uniref:LPS-assembly protein LptD n=1 Tax=Prosthecomicrobium sp. N25 TaxID=3129254 RepID=UPI0030784CE8